MLRGQNDFSEEMICSFVFLFVCIWVISAGGGRRCGVSEEVSPVKVGEVRFTLQTHKPTVEVYSAARWAG